MWFLPAPFARASETDILNILDNTEGVVCQHRQPMPNCPHILPRVHDLHRGEAAQSRFSGRSLGGGMYGYDN